MRRFSAEDEVVSTEEEVAVEIMLEELEKYRDMGAAPVDVLAYVATPHLLALGIKPTEEDFREIALQMMRYSPTAHGDLQKLQQENSQFGKMHLDAFYK